MRKHQQMQVLELIKTMNEAYAEIKCLFSLKEYDAVIQLLSDCQDFAVKTGGYIESIEGEGTRTVSLLEECHEALYQAGSALNGANPDIGSIKHLKEMFLKIESSVRSELKPDKIEVVFLPYKAAMWDSLESIWLAARADPNCDAYVVPIPYYDRMPDGTLGQMHYEGDQYPSFVPITDWQAYDIEARHPDIIYIHNPYDGGNYVTIIHPGFYAKRLKEFTDLLVYVPYFVCVDDVPEHFCVCSGTMHAGKVIVQSEKIRQTYIRVFRKFEKENHCAGAFGKAEDKFVALGSPKFDKVMHSKPEDFNLPEAWRRLIEKPDGTAKKIVLYNTSVEAILRWEEKYLQKVRYVLDIFRDRDNVVLWWRPHPLSEATYQSMRPQLLEQYKRIVAEYMLEGWGIYDDTPDLHRAIEYSDAYYGDQSSLVALYGVLQKHVLIQNIDVIQGVEIFPEVHALFANFVDDGKYVWFVDDNLSALCKMDRELWEPEIVTFLDGAKKRSVHLDRFMKQRNLLYRGIAQKEGQLFLCSILDDEIAVFDKKNRALSKIRSESAKAGNSSLFGAIVNGDSVFYTPYKCEAILEYNVHTGMISHYSDWLAPLNKLVVNKEDAYFLIPTRVGEHTLMLASCCANAVVSFDMKSCRSTVYEIGERGLCYGGICFDGQNYWLSPRHGAGMPIVKWDRVSGSIVKFENLPINILEKKQPFFPGVYCNGYVWFFAQHAERSVKIDVHTNEVMEISEFDYEEADIADNSIGQKYNFAYTDGTNIYTYNCKKSSFIQYNCYLNQRKEKVLLYSDKDIKMFLSHLVDISIPQEGGSDESGRLFREHDYFTVTAWMDSLAQRESLNGLSSAEQSNMGADGSAGFSIYKYCKEMLQ